MANQLIKRMRVVFQDLGSGGGNTQAVNCPPTAFATSANSVNGILVRSITPKCGTLAAPTTLQPSAFSIPGASATMLQGDVIVTNSSKVAWVTLIVTMALGSAGATSTVHIPLAPQSPTFLPRANITALTLVAGNTYNPVLAGPIVGSKTPLDIVVMG